MSITIIFTQVHYNSRFVCQEQHVTVHIITHYSTYSVVLRLPVSGTLCLPGGRYLRLAEFAVGVLLQRLQLLVLLLGLLQLVLQVCILAGALFQLKEHSTGALLASFSDILSKTKLHFLFHSHLLCLNYPFRTVDLFVLKIFHTFLFTLRLQLGQVDPVLHCVYSIFHTHYIRHITVQVSYLFSFEALKIKDSSFLPVLLRGTV